MIAPATDPAVWVRCDGERWLDAVASLSAAVADEGDRVTFQPTLPQQSDRCPPHPRTRRDLRTHLDRMRPILVLLLGGTIDMTVAAESEARNIPLVLVECAPDTLREMTGGWFRPRPKPVLSQIAAAFCGDARTAEAIRRLGAPGSRVWPDRPFEDAPAIPGCRDEERQEIATSLRTRPVWYARSLPPGEYGAVAEAQRTAARRAHRLLLCASPANLIEGPELARHFAEAGFVTGLRSAGDDPDEAMQVYVCDVEGEDGLWLRLAPISYAGGSLGIGALDDPFEAAALGAVVLHGPAYGERPDRFIRLCREGASLQVTEPVRLGAAVETLLAPDRTAEMATAGWDVTTRAAEVQGRIVALIQQALDGAPA